MKNPIISNIEAALNTGEMIPAPNAKPVDFHQMNYRDALRPYEEIFGTAERPEGFKSPRIFTYGGRFRPMPKRSKRPLGLPKRNIPIPLKENFQILWKSLRGVMEFYQEKQISIPCLDASLTAEGALSEFLDPLISDLPWPLDEHMSFLLEDVPTILDLECIQIPLPFLHYDEEGTESWMGFLEGKESVAGLMDEYYGDYVEELDPRDKELVDSLGWLEIVTTYYESSLEKKCDLKKLDDRAEHFFKPLFDKYPFADDLNIILAGMDGNMIPLLSKDHVEFAFEYLDVWDNLLAANPGGFDFEYDENGEKAALARDMLKIYRLENDLEPVHYEDEEAASDYDREAGEEDYDCAA